MDKSKRKVVKTLYLENLGVPFRFELTKDIMERTKELQTMIENLSLKRNEAILAEIRLNKVIIRIRKAYIDIGTYGYEGWDSFLTELGLKSLEEIPDVYFSSMFLYVRRLASNTKTEAFMDVIKPKHKELLIWKQIEGES